MAYGNVNVDTVTTSTSGGVLGAGNASIMKNRIINGAMVISQRNGTSSVTPSNGDYVLDRWRNALAQASKFTVQQNAGSVTPPAGFTNYLGITSSSAYSVGASDYFGTSQIIEGYNVADLGWGTANAKTVTLSFWVRSSLTGSFGGSIYGGQYYPFTYSIPVANTWTQISVTIAGSTSGTWATDNSAGINVFFGLGIGSSFSGTAGAWTNSLTFAPTGAVSVVGTSGATFYITGVQLEVGSSATGFEYRLYNQELSACQRYYQALSGSSELYGYCYTTNSSVIGTSFPTSMRVSPTLTTSGTFTGYNAINSASAATITANVSTPINISFLGAFTATAGTPTRLTTGGTGTIMLSSEL